MRIKRCNLFVAGHCIAIIDQQAHAHPAISRMQHSVGKQSASFVLARNVILKVECSFCGIDHLHADQEPIGAYRNDAKSGVATMLTSSIVELATESSLVWMSEGRRRNFRKIGTWRKRGASTENCDEQ